MLYRGLLLSVAAICGVTGIDQGSFIVVGDWGDPPAAVLKDHPEQLIVAEAMEEHCTSHACDCMFSTGDNIYNNGPTSAQDPRFDLLWRDVYNGPALGGLVWHMALGNHDHRLGHAQFELDFAETEPRWNQPELYYNITLGDPSNGVSVFVVVMDTDPIEDGRSPEATVQQLIDVNQWLQNAASLGVDWILVTGHHPPYSCGAGSGSLVMQDDVVPIFEANNVDVAFFGHEHNLQHFSNNGIDYVTSGGGGRGLSTYRPNVCADWEAAGLNPSFFHNYGYAYVTATVDTLTVQLYDGLLQTSPPLFSFTRTK